MLQGPTSTLPTIQHNLERGMHLTSTMTLPTSPMVSPTSPLTLPIPTTTQHNLERAMHQTLATATLTTRHSMERKPYQLPTMTIPTLRRRMERRSQRASIMAAPTCRHNRDRVGQMITKAEDIIREGDDRAEGLHALGRCEERILLSSICVGRCRTA